MCSGLELERSKEGVIHMMQFSRRCFLKAGAAGLALASSPLVSRAGAMVGQKRKIQVGVQLYSVRELC